MELKQPRALDVKSMSCFPSVLGTSPVKNTEVGVIERGVKYER
jgi:hypothetical protein